MPSLNSSDVFTRRSVLLASVAGFTTTNFVSGFGDTRFWDKKDPSAWTFAEIQQLTRESPWAKQTIAVLSNNNSSLAGPSTVPGRRGRMSGGSSRTTTASNLPKFPVAVRWASAKPMLQAMKLKLPASLNDYYVIGVSGLPIASSGSEQGVSSPAADPFAELKEQTFLQAKRGDPIQPGEAYQDPNDTSSVYFGFLRQFLDLTESNVATFSTEAGPFAVKVKFHLKEMKYRGELAV